MKILNTIESQKVLPQLFTADHRLLGVDPLGKPTPEVLERRHSPMCLYSSVFSDDGATLLGCFAVTITTDAYYRALLAGTALEGDFEPWDQEDTPVLFLRHLVINDRRVAPYVFRYLLKDIHAVCELYDIYIHRAYAISPHWSTGRILQSYNFESVGLYRGKYPIVMASRDTSIVLNSFLKNYPAEEKSEI